MYKLRYEPPVEAVWDSLPGDAREEFDHAIRLACQDPWTHTRPRSDDDHRDVRRALSLQLTYSTLIVIDAPHLRRLLLRRIHYLG